MTTVPSKEELIKAANEDATVSPYRVSVLYGDYGKRKTTTACAMSKEKCLLLSSDDSWKVLLNDRHKELYSRVTVKPLGGLSQLEHVDMEGYDTIVWDTISQSAEFYLDLLYDEANWGGRFRDKIVSNNADLKGLEVLAAMDYRVLRDVFRPVLNRLFRKTKAHIIFTSQQNDVIKGLSQDEMRRPAVSGATFKIIGTRADIIGHLKPGNGGKFTIDMTEGSITSLGKSRIEGLQGKMDLDNFVSKYKEIVFK
jgi:hypothetical protein